MPFQIAVVRNSDPNIRALLLDNGANKTAPPGYASTYHFFAENNHRGAANFYKDYICEDDHRNHGKLKL